MSYVAFVLGFLFVLMGLFFTLIQGNVIGLVILFQGVYMIHLGFKNLNLDRELKRLRRK